MIIKQRFTVRAKIVSIAGKFTRTLDSQLTVHVLVRGYQEGWRRWFRVRVEQLLQGRVVAAAEEGRSRGFGGIERV